MLKTIVIEATTKNNFKEMLDNYLRMSKMDNEKLIDIKFSTYCDKGVSYYVALVIYEEM